ncbi:MAG: hypothetical protein JXN64_01295 [Spirochaetes bacterium]|nr:hypothetical protein [Spirochaetota bacterium]
MAKTLFGVWISDNISNLKEVGEEISEQCKEAFDTHIDTQLSLSTADEAIKQKIGKKAKYNGLSSIKQGFNSRMQKNLEKYKV